ncbi:MAG: hypothetical protein WC997_02305 [Porticoccaceae bacterium]
MVGMIKRVTQVVIAPEGADLYDERGLMVGMTDDGGGEFVIVRNCCGEGSLRIEPEDWPGLRAAINRMVEGCKA